MTSKLEEVRMILGDVLQLGSRTHELRAESRLLGELPELDSMAVVALITAIEEHYDIRIEDEEIDAEAFETLGALARFVEERVR